MLKVCIFCVKCLLFVEYVLTKQYICQMFIKNLTVYWQFFIITNYKKHMYES